jgi:hypothetical protein
MGVSSIIAILVILVLVVFSALSITTSKADLRLAQKSSDSIKAFYEADAAAEDRMAEIAEAVLDGGSWQQGLTGAGCELTEETGGTVIAFTVPIDENRNLNVELFAADGKLSRQLWQVVPAKEWVPDTSVNLFIP